MNEKNKMKIMNMKKNTREKIVEKLGETLIHLDDHLFVHCPLFIGTQYEQSKQQV